MRRRGGLATLLLLPALAAGCGSTVIESNLRDARIYMDGKYVGAGTVSFSRVALPWTSDVRVEAPDGRVIHATIENPYYLRAQFRGGEPVGTARVAPPAPDAWGDAPHKSGRMVGPTDPWMQAPYGWKSKTPPAYDAAGDEAKAQAR